MTHQPRTDQLADLALGLLEPAEARALEAHAAGCAACRDELAALRQTRQLLAGLPPLEAPARGAAVVLAAARQAAEAAGQARRPWWAAPRWLAGGAVGLVGATALAVLLLRVSPPSTTVGEPEPAPARAALQVATSPALSAAPVAAPGAGPAETASDRASAATATAERERPARRAARPTAASVDAADSVGAAAVTETRRAKAGPASMAEAMAVPSAAPAATAAIASGARLSEASGAVSEPRPLAEAKRLGGAPAAPRGTALMKAEAVADRDDGPPCRLEQRRRLVLDAGGKVIGRVREGRYPGPEGEVSLTVEERYGADGRLVSASVLVGDRRIAVGEAEVAAGRLEPLRGVRLAPTAAEAAAAPPRCQP
jgi:anti-sigma factor ChrR (cupin superfamily)